MALWVLVVVGLCVPVGGGPTARSPHASLRLGVVDLEARPSPPDPPAPSTPVGLFIAVHIPSRPRRQAPQSGLSCPAAHASPSEPAVPGVLVGDRRRFKARLCTAAAHRHPPAPRPGSAGLAVPSMREPAAGSRRSRSPAKPSGPSGTLHTGGAFHCCAHPIQASPPTGTAAKPHSQASFVPQLTRCPPRRRCLVCWWVIGVVLKPGQVLPPPTGTHRHRGQAPRASRCPQQRAVPGVLVGDRRRFEARPGPAPAHRHPPAPRPGSAGLAVPSTKGGAWCAGGVIGVVLKPGYALPPPTGTAMGTSRRLYACVGFQSGLLGGAALGAGWRRVVGVSRL